MFSLDSLNKWSNKYLLCAYYLPDSVLRLWYNSQRKGPNAIMGLTFYWGGAGHGEKRQVVNNINEEFLQCIKK